MRSFTLVVAAEGLFKPELHATGCRDLAKVGPGALPTELLANTGKEAVKASVEAQLIADAKAVKVNACCNLKRMDQAGRGHVPGTTPVGVNVDLVAAGVDPANFAPTGPASEERIETVEDGAVGVEEVASE